MGVLKNPNGIGLLMSVVLVLGYLIAWPHLGTVYVETMSTFDNQTMATRDLGDVDDFPTRARCSRDVRRNEYTETYAQVAALNLGRTLTTRIIYRCQSEVRLLWGW